MEAFSLLKYWRGGGGGGGALAPSSHTTPSPTSHTTNAAVAQNENPTESDDEDEGPFFDLEFTVPDEVDDSDEAHENPNANNSSEESEGEREFKFTLSPSSNDRNSLSPSEDLFFKGKLVQVEPSEPNSKPQLSASLFKSATKFRVFMLGLKKPKSDSAAANPESQEKQQQQQAERIKFKVEEVPIMSLLTRDNSSKVNKSQSQNTEDSPSCLEDKQRLSKEVVMHKYLKMVKPLYIRVSRKYGDKLNSSSGGKAAAPATAAEGEAVPETGGTNVKSQKQGNLPAGLRVVCKHLGKSRSASSAVAAAPPAFMSSKRRDDSLLQQQDGIQGAILHCKRSFNASRESESSQLPRSVSDSLHEISSQLSRKSINEGKDKLSFA